MNANTQHAVEILTQLMARKNRLKNGLEDRLRLRKELESGQDISKEKRYRFVMDAANQLTDYIKDLASQYDRDNPTDQASTLDILDILMVVQGRFGGRNGT